MTDSGIYLKDDDITKFNRFASEPDIKDKITEAIQAVRIAAEYFKSFNNVDIDTTSLCCVENFIQSYGITDIYINGFFIDIITVPSGSEYCVPCFHFDKDIAPLAYMFIDENDSIVKGFVLQNDIDKNNIQNGYYVVDKDTLKNFDDIEYWFSGHDDIEIQGDFQSNVFDYFDDNYIDTQDFIKVLLNSKEARKLFLKAYRANRMFNGISVPRSNTDENITNAHDYSEGITDNNEIPYTMQENISEQELSLDDSNTDNFNIGEMADSTSIATDNIADNNYDKADEQTITEQMSDYNTEESKNGLSAEILEEFSTGTTPSLEDIEKALIDNDTCQQETMPESETSIDELYRNNANGTVYGAQFVSSKKRTNLVPLVLLLVFVISGGYFGYKKFLQNTGVEYSKAPAFEEPVLKEENNDSSKDAMPDESVENTNIPSKSEEAIDVSIPAIEKNLDASILVENLSVNWQVPTSYVSNSAAKRYFTKIGKIIQLNLKTEMLLLNKVPLSDKIALELEFNKNTQNFEIKKFKVSSGEKTIDDLVSQIVNNVVQTSKYADMSIFNGASGNPVLIIHL